ncbi:UBA domain-containing protein 3-like isoform X2 [Phragmites australis]|uniref:UBA domain-containing protein 3-like isoform X2 n=1 Tax=Phragmites australis TaxID=29695 RepID=UPI002D76B1D9|nr:UBA domain-containing protein 3-like isoform X2 [Phragmites australis]
MGSRVKEEERNEKIIRGLLKLPGNRRCINCNSLGPQYVCTSFSTFICTNCSGIHREFTHRVKSISVAKFTSQEVSALQEGGNERAKEIYFKHWDIQGQSVIDNSDVDGLRTFIKNVYVEQRYTGQRIGDHLPQAKIQGSRDSCGNRNEDSSQVVLRSPYVGTYEDNHGPKPIIEGLSEDQNNSNEHPLGHTVDRNNSSNFRSHLRPDDLPKTGGKSENDQRDVTASASSVLQASKNTKSNNVILPIRLPDPPRSHKATTSNASAEAQKSTSQWTNDPRPGSMQDAKLYVSENLIDFDSDLEPPQDVVQTKIQKNPLPPTDIGWATFDVATPQNTTTMTSTFSTNSLEGSMLQIPNSASMPQSRLPTVQTAKSLSFSLANHGSQQHQHYFSPVNNIQSSNPPLNRTTSAPVDSQLWRAASHAPMLQGNSILPSNQGSNILIGNRDPVTVSASQQLLADITSNGRKALPEDIFTMSYRPVSSSWNWQPNPRVNMGYGQYGTHYPVGITQHAHPYNINPVNLARGPTSAHASSRFPSLTSMQEALPNVASTALLPHAPGMGSVGSVLSPRQVAFPSTADNQYMIQQHAVKVQNDTFPIGYGVRGFATTATAYGLSPMDQHLAAQNALPRVGGNPFA